MHLNLTGYYHHFHKLEAQKPEPVSLTWYELGLITQMLQANQIQEFPMATIFVVCLYNPEHMTK